ncbi:MAG: hypothetical protein M3463_18790, partial [Verrucomicrobiota bacterium]|nr:hypothetical protein [Verrucomicrobiota bacterium]
MSTTISEIVEHLSMLPNQVLTLATHTGLALLLLLGFWLAGVVAFRVIARLAGRADAGRNDVLLLLAQI